MFGTPSGNMQNVLGRVNPVTTVAPVAQSPADLLTRLNAGGITEWRKMTQVDKMRLIWEYGKGSEDEFMKQFKRLTGKELDLRSEAIAAERLDSRQIQQAVGFPKLKGGSALHGPSMESILFGIRPRTQKARPRKAGKAKNKGSRKRKVITRRS
jgi:hypothetical protein